MNASRGVYMVCGGFHVTDRYSFCGIHLRSATSERDLSFVVSSTLNTHQQINRPHASAKSKLEGTKRTFGRLSESLFKTLWASQVRIRLERTDHGVLPVV